ncbi:hypothetical protein [Streptomyces sp. 900105245]
MKTWGITIHDADGNQITSVGGVRPDLAEALVAALGNERTVEPPRHATGFNWLTNLIAQTSRVIQHLDAFREEAIVAADKTHTLADRKAIAIAAGMPPSRLYRILERHGRPRNRATT